MKKLIHTALSLTLILFLTYSCHDSIAELKPDQLIVEKASQESKVLFSKNLDRIMELSRSGNSSSDGSQGFDLYDYNTSELVKLLDNESKRYLYTAIHKENKSLSLTFAMDENTGDIYNAFVSENIDKVEEGFVLSNVYDINGQLQLSFELANNWDRRVTYVNERNQGGITSAVNGWWSRFDDCVGLLNGPTDSNVVNILFASIANAATLGLYTPLSVVVCAGVATGSTD